MEHFDLPIIRHSTAHLLAQAVLELYPGTLLTIGPATEEGFFYDFLPVKNFKEEDLPLLEQRMHELAEKNIPITHHEISKEEARILFGNNRFKMELLENLPGDTVGLSVQGDFKDLCRGGHVPSTGYLKNFKLFHISGSYWRADRSGQPLQRITGTAFATKEELADYLRRREEAELYDHRRLGKQLELFSFHDEGVGFPFFHPKGKRVITTLIHYMRKLQEEHGYQEVSTPTMLNDALWKQSGHWAHYQDKMYLSVIDEQSYAIKPMNCPGAILIYKTRPRSYRELPLKLSEFGHVHRHELSGVLHGLMRVRAFTIDDAHTFCTPEQLNEQVAEMITFITTMLKRFDFAQSATFAISTRPEQSMGSDELWEKATTALKQGLEKASHSYVLQEGEGAFYGPKIEVTIRDSLGRSWQCGTIQIDFNQPENFDLTYVTPEGDRARPVIIHQATFGSLERFFAILLEHYKGHLPLWLAPLQARILPITDEQRPYAYTVEKQLKAAGVRVEVDESTDPLSGQIKRAQLDKIPLMLVLGKKEAEAQTVTVRHSTGKQDVGISIAALIDSIHQS